MENLKTVILLSNTFEPLSNNKGYLSTFVYLDRTINKIVNISYTYSPRFNCKESETIKFDNFEAVENYLKSLY